MDPFLGQIVLFAGNFAPRGWALCQGQLLPINQNQALFSLFGTIYGGDGRTTFALPDMRGRAPVSFGQGPGLSNRNIGEKGGSETNVITVSNMPSHNHGVAVPVSTGAPEENAGYLGSSAIYTEDATPGSSYPGITVSSSGGGMPVNNLQPFLSLNYIVCLQGVFPSRN
jgi:microcystin-dependent protein